MSRTPFPHFRSGFTLLELVISLTIFGILSVMILEVYFSATITSRRLNASRQLSETSREILDRIGDDIRTSGINTEASNVSPHAFSLYNNPQYTLSGGHVLAIGSSGTVIRKYIYGKRVISGIDPCTSSDKIDPYIHCGLYTTTDGNTYYNLVDSFIPDEAKKRVKIEDLSFYISGGAGTADKLTLNFSLTLMPRIGVPLSLIGSTKLRIQTTLSERIFTSY